jgi:hypothetical protein
VGKFVVFLKSLSHKILMDWKVDEQIVTKNRTGFVSLQILLFSELSLKFKGIWKFYIYSKKEHE